MKRTHMGRSDGTPGGGGERYPAKRTKSSQACASCRRHKTRCELLDDLSVPGVLKCHRCKVLSIQCSFETSDIIHIIPSKILKPGETSTSAPTQKTDCSDGSPMLCSAIVPDEDQTLHSGITSSKSSPRVKAEDLIPNPRSLWGIMNLPVGFDWTATPILAVQELMNISPTGLTTPIHQNHHEQLGTIFSPEQISSLLEIFEIRYGPWINVQTRRRGGNTPLLDLVRCTVASRHLDPVTRARVGPRLQKLTRPSSLQQMFNPVPSVEYIEALTILSMWTPLYSSTTEDTVDPRSLAATAVSMAINMRLPEASSLETNLLEDKVRENGLLRSKVLLLSESMDRARLWILLSTAESLLCIGTGRTPLSNRSHYDHSVVDMTSYSSFESSREMRLGLTAKLYDLAEKGRRIIFASAADNAKFSADVTDILIKMDCLRRFIAPLPVVSVYDTFYFQMLLVQYYGCRLLVLFHTLQEVRRVFEKDDNQPWFSVDCPGDSLVRAWARDALASAEAVLTCTLAWHEHELLSTMPDNIFSMIAFSAAWLVISNFSMFQRHSSHLEGACDRLLSMVIVRLSRIALTADHPAAKASHLISSLFTAWQRVTTKPTRGDGHSSASTSRRPTTLFPTTQRAPQYGSVEGYYAASSPSHSLTDDGNSGTGPECFADTEFWKYFINNLSSNSGIANNS